MKVIVAVFAVIALCYCQETAEPIPILRYDSDGPNPDGSYKYSYETGNGISAEEQGELKNAGTEDLEALEVRGSYQYTAPDGSLISVSYIANENGFQPTGTHISVPGSAPHVPLRAGGSEESAQGPQPAAPAAPAAQQVAASPQPIAPAPEEPLAEAEAPQAPEGGPEDEAPVVNDAEASFLRPVYRPRTGKAYKYYQPRKY